MPDLHHHHHHATPKPNPKLLSIFLKFIVMSLILSLFLLFIGLAAILLLHLLLAASVHRRHRRHRHSASSLSHILPPVEFSASQPAQDCSICLDCFNPGEICRVLPVCDHVFHARCVDRWLIKVPNCPVCRTQVRLDTSDSLISEDETKISWAIGVGS